MKSIDDILKIKAATLYVLHQFGGALDYVKLYKLLYYAQEYSLATYGDVVVDEIFKARDRGPVPSFLNASIKNMKEAKVESPLLKELSEALRLGNGFDIIAVEKPDMDELSGRDIECLDFSVSKYGRLSANELSDLSHHDRGYIKANNRRRIDPDQSKITRMDMARAGNASEEILDYLKMQIEIDQALAQ